MEQNQTPCHAEPQVRPTTTRVNGEGRREYPCRGLNHRCVCYLAICDACGSEVLQWLDDDNRKKQVTSNAYGVGHFCFAEKHECNADDIARHEARLAQDDVIAKGHRVVVVKGRKFPKGTAGTVFWVAPQPDDWEVVKVGFTSDDGEKIFINIKNIQKESK